MSIKSVDLLTIILALAAYLASVRHFGIERLSDRKDRLSAAEILEKHRALRFLILPDFCLIIAGFLICLTVLFDTFTCVPAGFADTVNKTVIVLFVIAVIILVGGHITQWQKGIQKYKLAVKAAEADKKDKVDKAANSTSNTE